MVHIVHIDEYAIELNELRCLRYYFVILHRKKKPNRLKGGRRHNLIPLIYGKSMDCQGEKAYLL